MEPTPTSSPSRTARRFILIAFALFAILSVAFGVYRAVTSSNDLHTRYEEWQRLVEHRHELTGWREMYLPVFYLAVSPLFALGWIPAKIIWLIINLFCGGYAFKRTSDLVGLDADQRKLALVLFASWASVRVTLSSAQVGLICLAGILWAFPLTNWKHGLRVSIGLVKHTLVFPIYLRLLHRRPRLLLIPFLVATAPLLMIWWLSGNDLATFIEISRSATGKMLSHWEGGTYIGSFLKTVIPSTLAMYAVIWTAWIVLYVFLTLRLRDEFMLLAGLLLMSLWPIYHRPYDLVFAWPALALFLKHNRFGWALTMTLYMLGWYEFFDGDFQTDNEWVPRLMNLYYPIFIFVLIGGLVRLSKLDRRETAGDAYESATAARGLTPGFDGSLEKSS